MTDSWPLMLIIDYYEDYLLMCTISTGCVFLLSSGADWYFTFLKLIALKSIHRMVLLCIVL